MLYFLLFATGLFAGAVDAIAGGGGLISLPMLLGLGIPPHLAFGTNKLQGTIGTLVATSKYYKHGLFSFKTAGKGIITGIIGSMLGAVAAQLTSAGMLHILIPILLLLILVYTIISPKLGSFDRLPRMSEYWFFPIFGFLLAFYDGFFGPGTGSLWVFALTFFLGYNLIKATAYTKLFNLNSSLIATFCFAIGGNIDYRIGLCMALGQIIGARLGAHLAISKGAPLIRPIFLTVVASTIVTLIYKNHIASGALIHFAKTLGTLPLIVITLALSMSLTIFFRWKNKRRSVS